MNIKALVMAALASGITVAGCSLGVAVPIRGEPRWVTSLAGEWNGTYIRDDRQREGTIWFALKDGEGHAYGDVRMAPQHASPYVRHDPDAAWQWRDTLGVLAIRFVSVAEVGLEGSLEPYWDPDCRCRATTTFRGRLSGKRLSGTFLTRHEDGSLATGRWQAQRTRAIAIEPIDR
jgi:hypothetical protein